jgi:hypothetical protein
VVLLVVVQATERIEFVEAGLASLCVGVSVVDLDRGCGDGLRRRSRVSSMPARRVARRWARARVGDVEHVDPFGDDELEDGVAEQLACRGGRDRSEPGDLAELVVADVAAYERFPVDS